MTHLSYVVAAYLVSAVVLAAMVAWVLADLRAQRRRLDRLEKAGLRRRPEAL
jgi:heme exporter protein D